ncbi:hypothetical protein EVAR_4092_1 [Eumeta japonica]|uniref:DUF5641 domain-containing protein n=1 Tax=Eumeta variegata TaxID=151549 RepID=A0A4C1T6Y7_EUMVA|nr:hypothetical protein EVAR_4092_1 [Eumeta japonica]
MSVFDPLGLASPVLIVRKSMLQDVWRSGVDWDEQVKEYLPTLVPRRARVDPRCRAPAEGDVVLIVDSSSPRYSWPPDKIRKTYPGPDNQVRVVDVETTRGVLRHLISKIRSAGLRGGVEIVVTLL